MRNSISSWGAIVGELLDDDLAGTSGKEFAFKVFDAKTDLSCHKPITDLLDVEMLPAAIGGNATSFDEEGKADEHYSSGVVHPSVIEFCERLGRGS